MTDQEYLKAFGEKLKQLRLEKGLRQIDVCDVAEIDKAYLSAIENGKQNPSLLMLRRICSALEVDLLNTI